MIFDLVAHEDDPVLEQAGCDSSYQPVAADLGHQISVQTTGALAGFADVSVTAPAVGPVALASFATTPTPLIGGTPTVGQTLHAVPGTWAPAGATFTYQWHRNGADVAGATTPTYHLTAADAGKRLAVTVTAHKSLYADTAKSSAETRAVVKLLTAGHVRITGTATYGHTLTASAGTWTSGTTLHYRWYAGASPISGQTGRTYRPGRARVGTLISVHVTGSKAGYAARTANSGQVKIAPATFASVSSPTVTGTLRAGATLRAHVASSPSARWTYQWRRNGAAIAGATHSTYKVHYTDVGRHISVSVTAKRTGYHSVGHSSAVTSLVPGAAYRLCADLLAHYPFGVRKSGVTFNRVGTSRRALVGPPFVSTSLYDLNTKLDRDKDGIACEQSS